MSKTLLLQNHIGTFLKSTETLEKLSDKQGTLPFIFVVNRVRVVFSKHCLCTKIVKQTSVSTLYIQHWVNDACGGEGSLTSKLMKVVVLKNSKAGA